MSSRAFSVVALLAALGCGWVVVRAASQAPAPTFNADIRPILSENCFHCHGVDAAKRKAGLRLDVEREAIASGAMVPGHASASVLVERLRSADPDELMPPPSSHRALSEGDKRLIERWIDAGARYEEHWAFVAPTKAKAAPGEHPIDAAVRRRLAREGLSLSPEAPRETLVRRVTLDLTGLPPTLDEIDAFLADRAPDAYERLVDRLLASPRYGERMVLPWLDAARYADSNGFQQDGDTFQWVWRDWLVRQLNADVPYDRLSTEMLAGDLLPGATDETRLATAFNRNHLLNGEGGAIPEENRWTAMFDRVDATATTWLGLTMSCAQCHDHKYDPITQRDYYALLDAFNRVPEDGIVAGSPSRIRVAPPVLEYADEALRARRMRLEGAVAAAEESLRLKGDAQRAARDEAQGELDRFLRDEWPRVMVMSDAQPRETHVLARGAYLSPAEKVAFATPAFLPPLAPDAPRDRLGLARWLFADENPLVARVAANRAWQLFFGEGLVKTPEDFGVQSEVPVHRELLDDLAVRLREGGWRMKDLHRLIVTSAVYRQSSEASPALRARDPENRLLARAPRFRMPAMLLRDQALAHAGLLVEELGGMPVYPYQPADVWEPLAITKERDFTYPASHGRDLHRRSLYTFWRRTIAPTNMFDTASRQTCRVRTATTASPLHALTTLNDPTWVEAARTLAERLMHEGLTGDAAAARAFRMATGRAADAEEARILSAMLARQRAMFPRGEAERFLSVGEVPRDATLDATEHAALAAVCLAIFNLDEAMTRG
ncbi:MAG: PSD1 and planctomycete cytochrome C domain-containing protein [Planctomycetaceae bacterium]|nr:PSD1 and planctomycete cytochrome C domain-containing protein [Planctomycetaceae bacterium]